jgi:hypothetical protein
VLLQLILNHFALSISGPEKAGGGGSISSLATHCIRGVPVLAVREK